MQDLLDVPPDTSQEESVALRNEDWPAINAAIDLAIKRASDSFTPHGWRKAVFLLRQLGPIATSVAVIVALFAIAAGAIYQATARVAKEATFETNTERDLKEIRDDIKAIRGDLAKQSLINHASLPLSDFKATLPEVSSAIATAKQQEVKVAPKVIDDLQRKITLAGEDAPGFWPAAAMFISYRSQTTAADFQGLLRPDLPNCTDRNPTPMRMINATDAIPSYYDNCRFTLDSVLDDAKINSLFNNQTFGLVFRHCLIVYHGGQIDLKVVYFRERPSVTAGKNSVSLPVTVQLLRLENCLFNFILPDTPPPEGQELAKRLLAENGSTIEFSSIPKSSTHS